LNRKEGNIGREVKMMPCIFRPAFIQKPEWGVREKDSFLRVRRVEKDVGLVSLVSE
jgi:hypothetical protein